VHGLFDHLKRTSVVAVDVQETEVDELQGEPRVWILACLNGRSRVGKSCASFLETAANEEIVSEPREVPGAKRGGDLGERKRSAPSVRAQIG
jgi:hypothetical protein